MTEDLQQIGRDAKAAWIHSYAQMKQSRPYRKQAIVTCTVEDKNGKECGATARMNYRTEFMLFLTEHTIEGSLHKKSINFFQWLFSHV